SRKAGGIFVNIKRMVEMRNAQTLEIKFPIKNEIFREVSLEQLAIFHLEHVECERLSAFFDGVNDAFELSKHRLPKKSTANVIDLPVNDIGAHFRIGSLLEQMMGE